MGKSYLMRIMEGFPVIQPKSSSTAKWTIRLPEGKFRWDFDSVSGGLLRFARFQSNFRNKLPRGVNFKPHQGAGTENHRHQNQRPIIAA